MICCPSHGWQRSCRTAWAMAGVHAVKGSFSQWVLRSVNPVLCTTLPSQTGFSVPDVGCGASAGSNSCKGQEKAGLKQEQPGKRAHVLQVVPCDALALQSSEPGGRQHILLQKCFQ